MTYIDYEGEAHENEPPSLWTSSNMGQYWKMRWQSKFGSMPQWRVREVTLLSRLLKRYSPEQLVEMIDCYFERDQGAYSFGVFSHQADNIWAKLNEPRQGYQW